MNSKTKLNINKASTDQADFVIEEGDDIDWMDQATIDQVESAIDKESGIDYLSQETIDQIESPIEKDSGIDHLDQATIDQVESAIEKDSGIDHLDQATIDRVESAIGKTTSSKTTTSFPAPTRPQKTTWPTVKRKQPLDPKLKATVDKIERLTKQNPEFNKMLRERLGIQPTYAPNIVAGNERLDQIYEYCIEKVVRHQAEEFYKDFPIKPLADGLIEDFCRMEYFRRKDNFSDFSLAVYQQLESITNLLAANEGLDAIAQHMWWYPAYVKTGNDINDFKNAIRNRLDNSTYCIADLVFIKRDVAQHKSEKHLKELYAVDKMRAIVYFVGYNAVMPNGEYSNYVRLTDMLYKIYQCRNTNHRGGLHSQNEGAAIDVVLSHKSVYYFCFLGALTQFVEMVKNGAKNIDAMKEHALSIEAKPCPLISLNIKGKIDLSGITKR